jgi:hypothetical protein
MDIKKYFSVAVLALAAGQAMAWGNHALPSYRALEQLPELAKAAPVKVETLENFLRDEEKTIEALLASQEAWAIANIQDYPKRPDALGFVANPKRSDEARRLAFLMALRVAPNSKLALFYQPDPAKPFPTGTTPVAYSDVNTLPEPAHHNYRVVLSHGVVVSTCRTNAA